MLTKEVILAEQLIRFPSVTKVTGANARIDAELSVPCVCRSLIRS